MQTATQQNLPADDDRDARGGENGGPQQHSGREEVDIQPFRVIRSMDGNDWRYTTAVLTTMTLGITMLFFERGFLEGRGTGLTSGTSEFNMTSTRIVRYLILLAFAMGIGMLSWLLLMPNLQTVDNTRFALLRARKWIFWSTVGFAITNLGAILNGLESQAAFEWEYDRGRFVSPVAHYLLLVFFFMALLVTDVLFVRVVLFPFLDGLVLPSVDNQREYEFRIHRDVLVGFRDGDWEAASFFGKAWMILTRTANFLVDITARVVISLLIGFYLYIWTPISKFISWSAKGMWGVVKAGSRCFSDSMKNCCGCLGGTCCCQCFSEWRTRTATAFAEMSRSIETRLASYVDRNRQPSADSSTDGHGCSFSMVLKAISSSLGTVAASFILTLKRKITGLRPGVEERASQFWDSIKEEEDFRHSSWVKASVLTSVILLFYFGFTLVAVFQGAFKDVYKKHRDCVLENPKLADFFLRSAGFGQTSIPETTVGGLEVTSLASSGIMDGPIKNLSDGEILSELQELVTGIRDAGEVQCLNIQDRRTRLLISAVTSFETNQAMIEETSPSDHFSRRSIGETAIVTDVILENLNWSIWLGFVVGLLIGGRSLLTIFAQYKRVAMALRTGFFDAIPEELRKSLNFGPLVLNSKGQDPRWNKLLKVYQLSQMVFFTGMLVSTAVLQLVVFGALVSLLVALVASLSDRDVLRILSPVLVFLLAMLIAWLVNNVVALILAESLLLDGYIIRHEMTFLFFSLVFSMVHLVLGVLLALFRLLFLLLSTLSLVNRLDINLFLTWQYRDIGHRSFIAMALLNHVNELSIICKRKPHAPPNDPVSQREDASKYPEIHIHLGGIKAASQRLQDFDATRRLRHAAGDSGSGGYVPPERVDSIFQNPPLPPEIHRHDNDPHRQERGSRNGSDCPEFPQI
ncbi:hypothetical protein BSKO_11815 [Bryopsis sp. KO-2023]|nr:hypothetical protein BSKO_11815 [Bryopsis sp. KO-2023]